MPLKTVFNILVLSFDKVMSWFLFQINFFWRQLSDISDYLEQPRRPRGGRDTGREGDRAACV